MRFKQLRFVTLRSRRRGSTLLETALCLGFVLLPLTLGGLQFGLVLTTTQALEQVSREAGRFASLHGTETTFMNAETQGDNSNDDPSLKHYLRDVARENNVPWNDIKNSITVTPTTRILGQPVTVSITYPMRKRSILGSLGFMGAGNEQAAKQNVARGDKRLDGGIKSSSLNLGFLTNDYTISSTFIVQ